MASVLDICNEALAEIGAGSIASLNEQSVESRECERFYQSVISDLLELHDWGFGIRRVALAGVVNGRMGEWGYAYVKPVGVASIKRLLPYFDGAAAYPAVGWWGHPQWEALGPIRFIEDGGVIFTDLETAILEYTISTVDVGDMPALFRRAVVYELASRLAMPVKKDRQAKGDMIQLAANARLIAMADDKNRYPRLQQRYVSEVEVARSGFAPGYL